MSERHEIWKIADGLQMDLRNASSKLVELRARLAGLDLPQPSALRCPECGIKPRGVLLLAEHRYQAHDGPLPEHWADLDARVAP